MNSKDLLGQYQYVVALVSMAVAFSLPGLNTAALESVVKGHEGAVIRAVKISLFASLFGSLALLLYSAHLYFFQHQSLLAGAFLTAAIFFPPYTAMNTWNVLYDGRSMFRSSALRYVILNTILFLCLAVGLYLGFGLIELVFIFFFINVLCVYYFYYETVKQIKDRTDDRLDVQFGVEVTLQRLVLGMSSTIPTIAVTHFFGTSQVAVFYIATYFLNATFAFIGALFYIYFPTFFRGDKLNHKKIFIHNLFIGASFWFFFIIFLNIFFPLLYGVTYEVSRHMAYFISFIFLLIPFKAYFQFYYMTRKKSFTLIAIVGTANAFALMVFYLMRGFGFESSTTVYLYCLEGFTVIPLFLHYIKNAPAIEKSFLLRGVAQDI